MKRRFARSGNVVERQVRGSFILVPLGGDTARIDSLYTLNDVGSEIWRQAVEGLTEDQIVASITNAYDGDESAVRHDCRRLLDELVGIGALAVAEHQA